MVFRRDSKVDAFQRQISALRHQLGGESEDGAVPDLDRPRSNGNENSYLAEYAEFASIRSEQISSSHGPVDTLDTSPPNSVPPPIPAIDMHTSVIAHSTAWSGDLELSFGRTGLAILNRYGAAPIGWPLARPNSEV